MSHFCALGPDLEGGRGLVITGDQVVVNYAEDVMGVTAQQTRQTEHPLPEYRGRPNNPVSRSIARVAPRWSIGHNNGADLRCNSWFGKVITQKCDQSGQRDSSEQRQPATSILRHHSLAEVDLERTPPKTVPITSAPARCWVGAAKTVSKSPGSLDRSGRGTPIT